MRAVLDALEDHRMPWYITGSEALAVYGPPRQNLDLAYLKVWSGRLGLSELLDRMRAEAADAP